MRAPSVRGSAILTILVVFAAACGSDTTGPPAPQTAAQLAATLDSMYVSWWSRASTCEGSYAGRRACDLYFLELAPAYGVLPAELRLTYNGRVEHWKAVGLEQYTITNGTASNDQYWLAAYDTPELKRFLVTYSRNDSLITNLFIDDSTELTTAYGSISTMAVRIPDACAPVAGLTNPFLTSYADYACSRESITTTLSLAFREPGTDSVVATVQIDNAVMPGALFTNGDTSATATQRADDALARLRARLHSVDSPHAPQ